MNEAILYWRDDHCKPGCQNKKHLLNCCLKCGRWRLVLFLVLTVWISQLCSTISLLLITNSNKESIYCDCSGKICTFLICSLQESLRLIFVIILTTLFCSLNILLKITITCALKDCKNFSFSPIWNVMGGRSKHKSKTARQIVKLSLHHHHAHVNFHNNF